jgi:hypothetical protein
MLPLPFNPTRLSLPAMRSRQVNNEKPIAQDRTQPS